MLIGDGLPAELCFALILEGLGRNALCRQWLHVAVEEFHVLLGGDPGLHVLLGEDFGTGFTDRHIAADMVVVPMSVEQPCDLARADLAGLGDQ